MLCKLQITTQVSVLIEQCISEGDALMQRPDRRRGGLVGNVFRTGGIRAAFKSSQVTHLVSVEDYFLLCELRKWSWGVSVLI